MADTVVFAKQLQAGPPQKMPDPNSLQVTLPAEITIMIQ